MVLVAGFKWRSEPGRKCHACSADGRTSASPRAVGALPPVLCGIDTSSTEVVHSDSHVEKVVEVHFNVSGWSLESYVDRFIIDNVLRDHRSPHRASSCAATRRSRSAPTGIARTPRGPS